MTQPPSPDTQNQPGTDFTRLSKADASELLHYKAELEAVERISQALFQSIDLDELVETTLHIALEEVGAEAGSILLADPEKEELIFQYSIGEKPVPRGTGIPGTKVFPAPSSNPGRPGLRTRSTRMRPIFTPSIRRQASSPTT